MADTYITNVMQMGHYNDTDVIYGVVRNVAKQARDVVAGAWDTYDDADLDDYDITAAVAAGGLWSGSFPVEAANGVYIYQYRIRAGANPADGDKLIFSEKGYWNGAVFVTQSDVNTVLGATPISTANIKTQADTALTDYDPPTRTEATTDKDAIITEIDANETKIDAIPTVGGQPSIGD